MSLNLLPEIPREDVVQVEKKEKSNLWGVFFLFVVVVFTLVILGINLLVRQQYNRTNSELADSKNKIVSLNYNEVKQLTMNNKIDTYEIMKERDFNADRVLSYLMEVAQGLSSVDGLYLDSDMQFELKGKATSYANVARLWHDMSREEDYFENISLDYVRKSVDDGTGSGMGTGEVIFSFSGRMVKENVSKL